MRKADTRRKIQLGGLVIKAGLADEESNVLLGLLLEAKSKLADDALGEQQRQRWAHAGGAAFRMEQEK